MGPVARAGRRSRARRTHGQFLDAEGYMGVPASLALREGSHRFICLFFVLLLPPMVVSSRVGGTIPAETQTCVLRKEGEGAAESMCLACMMRLSFALRVAIICRSYLSIVLSLNFDANPFLPAVLFCPRPVPPLPLTLPVRLDARLTHKSSWK
jgi:hypothetical protein